ncbi:MAG: hypothetical protein H0V82_12675 [Candidatus Protochlamydia sp.]|nr:hypothetical protein [Candidatus Protochlamydia sp.]
MEVIEHAQPKLNTEKSFSKYFQSFVNQVDKKYTELKNYTFRLLNGISFSKTNRVFNSNIYSKIEIQKGSSEVGKRSLMESLLHLNAPFDPREPKDNTLLKLYVSTNLQKKELLISFLPKSSAEKMVDQARTNPEMGEKIKGIKNNFEKYDQLALIWNDKNAMQDKNLFKEISNEIYKAEKDLNQQFKNLETLSESHVEIIQIHGKVYLPDTLAEVYKSNNTQKKELMAEYFPAEMASQIASQARKYPVMQAGIDEIIENFEQWDEIILRDDKPALKDLQKKLEQQFSNLEIMSKCISEITINSEDAKAFMLVLPDRPTVKDPEVNLGNQKFTQMLKG